MTITQVSSPLICTLPNSKNPAQPIKMDDFTKKIKINRIQEHIIDAEHLSTAALLSSLALTNLSILTLCSFNIHTH